MPVQYMYMEHFEERYMELNARQREAVDAIDGPVMVIAGPGTGKTQLLSMRVANILRKTDTDPQNILCLTFTNKAAHNMRERLLQLAGVEARKVVVRTFHSLAAEIMNQYPDYFWQGARLSVAPDAVQDDIIQGVLAQLPGDNPLATVFAGSFTALPHVKEGLKLAKEAGLKPDELRRIITENIAYIDSIEKDLCDILSATLSFKKLGALQSSVDSLPKHKASDPLLMPLSTILCDSLDLAIEQDTPTNKTTNTGKWKKYWMQTVEGKQGMFAERKRNEWWLAVADVYEQYREGLHARGYYDYSDMLVEVLEQLGKNPEMLADLQERFQFVLIDEFQDTNAAQLRLAHLISDHYAANNRPNIMAVGDDDQSIFAFNGAELNNMLHFIRSYPDTKVIVLEDNYRSTQAILDSASTVIELAQDRLINRNQKLTKKLHAKKLIKQKSDIRHLNYPTQEHQYVAMSKQIKQRWSKGEMNIAVLARKHGSLRRFARILRDQNIPVRYDQQSNVFEHAAVQQICLISEIVVGITEGDKNKVNVALSKLLRHPMWQIRDASLWKLAVTNYSNPDYLHSLLSSDDEKLQSIGNWLMWLSRTQTDVALPRFLDLALGLEEGQYLLSPFREYYLSGRELVSEYLETLSAIQLLRQLTNEFASRADASLTDFVRFIELNASTGRVIADESWYTSSGNAVELLTVYKAKGLEFDAVYLIDAIDSMWSPRAGGRKSPANLQLQSYGEQDDDYVRLLYVAVSRARQTFIASSYSLDEKGAEILPTALLSSLALTTITEPEDTAQIVLESRLRWPTLNEKDERKLLGQRLEHFALSPTALIDFLNLAEAGPASFKERQILRLPRPHSAVGSYGTAVHAALETAQRLVNTAELKIEPVLDRFESTLQDQHLAPREYEQMKARGEQLIPKLLEHAPTLVPKGALSEQKLEAHLASGARIKGTLDSILVQDSGLLISDYKTGKALSSLFTKDKTKMVKAWRHRLQLLFYALLVQESGRFKANKITSRMLYVEAENPKQISQTLIPNHEELERLQKLITIVYKHIQDLNFPDVAQYTGDIEGIEKFEEDLLAGNI